MRFGFYGKKVYYQRKFKSQTLPFKERRECDSVLASWVRRCKAKISGCANGIKVRLWCTPSTAPGSAPVYNIYLIYNFLVKVSILIAILQFLISILQI